MGVLYRGSVAGSHPDEVPRRRFPALDPEPPPPPWWRRLLWPACVLAGAAVVVTAVQLLPSLFAGSPASRSAAARPGHRPAGPVIRASGHVVVVTASGSLALANPDGSHLARAGAIANVGDAVAASPDNRYISLLNGQVISVRPGPSLASLGRVPRRSGWPHSHARRTRWWRPGGSPAALAQLGLDAHADQLVEELSGGQQQRVAVARALALKPKLLIADEPTAELDPAARAVVLARIFDIVTGGGSLVVATHDPDVAGKCDRILDLRAGT